MGESTGPDRSRRLRMGSVAAGYLGISWLVLQVIDVVRGILPLPTWVAPAALALLAIGFVLVLATAWIQDDPKTTQLENAGVVPTDWQLAPRDALASLLRGQLPHLTWGRTILAGVVALSLLFGAAGVYVLATGGTSFRRPLTSATDSVVRVAVMPFTTSGQDLEVYREGMVSLLATNLDGLGDVRAIDSRTVMARWDERVGSGPRPDLDVVLDAARATGATHALIGGIVSTGKAVRLTAQLYELDTGDDVSLPGVDGQVDEIFTMVDGLAVSLVRTLLGSDPRIATGGSRLASLTTSSIPALRLYLEAEALFRKGAFAEALPLLEDAIAADSMFGLAVVRRAQCLGWMPGAVPADSLEAARRAIRKVLDRLSPRDAVLAEGGIIDFADRDANGERLLREFVDRYPDEAEGWYQYSDFRYHLNQIRGGTRDEILAGFDKAVELGPRFAPYYIHAVDGALIRGDSARTKELLERYRALVGEDRRWQDWTIAETIVFGTQPERLERAAAEPGVLARVIGSLVARSDRPQTIADASERYLDARDQVRIVASLRAGRWEGVRKVFPTVPSANRDIIEGMALRWAGAFGLGPDDVTLILGGATAQPRPEFWNADAKGTLSRLLAARDDGTGADPLLLAHMTERTGDIALAARLFEEESWRELAPAALYRIAKIHEAAGRSGDAVRTYQDFLAMWSGADPQLPPVRAAREAIQRLGH